MFLNIIHSRFRIMYQLTIRHSEKFQKMEKSFKNLYEVLNILWMHII